MTASTVIHQVDTHSVRLRLTEHVTIDLGHNPAYPDEATVTELAVNYETTKSIDSPVHTKVTSITYVLDHTEHQTAFVHPDFLDQPHEWPAWARDLVDQHRPLAQGLDECPQCAAPAIGYRIPEHRDGCPRNDPNS